MGKGGKAKGSWSKGKGKVMQTVVVRVPKGKSKGKGKFGGVKGKWVFKGSSKGSSKGKGKGKRAASLNSRFWERKVEEEAREELGNKTYTGVIQSYNWKKGFGFIKATNFGALPGQVKGKVNQAEKAAVAEGKELTGKGLLYFRKPDVNHEDGFRLTADVPVKFKLYVDELGAGACDVSMAGAPQNVKAPSAKGGKKGNAKTSVIKTSFIKNAKGKGKGKGQGKESAKNIDNSLKVWVGGVADTVTAEDLQALFKTAGKATFAKLGKNGTAVVAFASAKDASTAIESLNGVELEGQTLEVDKWQKAEKSD